MNIKNHLYEIDESVDEISDRIHRIADIIANIKHADNPSLNGLLESIEEIDHEIGHIQNELR